MMLELANGRTFQNPDAETIERALHTLDGDNNNYAILSRDEDTYIQMCGDPQDGYVVEYQEGSTDAHFQSVRDDLPIDEVRRAFEAYARGDEAWRKMFEWKPLLISTPSRRGTGLLMLLPVAGLLAAWLIARMIGE